MSSLLAVRPARAGMNLVHPSGGPLADGGGPWPADAFTFRRLKDRDITLIDGGVPPVIYAAGDVVLIQRSGQSIELSGATFLAYLAPLLGGTPPPDTTAPTITVSPSQTVAENASFSLTLTANESVTWAKTGGADAALFILSGNTLTLPAKDFEAPADANGDNAYVVIVTATDAAGNASTLTITVTVTDINESGFIPPVTATLIAIGAI